MLIPAFCRSLDLSFNLLKSVPDRLEKMPLLSTIYFVQNKISRISGLSSLVNLRSLELGGNRIRVCHLGWSTHHLPFSDNPRAAENREPGRTRKPGGVVVGKEQDYKA